MLKLNMSSNSLQNFSLSVHISKDKSIFITIKLIYGNSNSKL